MKVAIYGQTYQNNALDYVVAFLDELQKTESEAYFEEEFYKLLFSSGKLASHKTFNMVSGLDDSFDMFVSFGGDGTILNKDGRLRTFGTAQAAVKAARAVGKGA